MGVFLQFFLANLSYQEALRESSAVLVKMVSSAGGLFVLVLAALFPSSSGDRFTLSKFVAVLLR
jgi:solute carrier family 35 protein F5